MVFENSWIRELRECLRVFHDFVEKFNADHFHLQFSAEAQQKTTQFLRE